MEVKQCNTYITSHQLNSSHYLFLDEQSQINKEKELKELEQEFDKFKKDWDEGLTPSNPVHSTKQGNKLVSENKHKEAIEK